jgi:hypothetical protein
MPILFNPRMGLGTRYKIKNWSLDLTMEISFVSVSQKNSNADYLVSGIKMGASFSF